MSSQLYGKACKRKSSEESSASPYLEGQVLSIPPAQQNNQDVPFPSDARTIPHSTTLSSVDDTVNCSAATANRLNIDPSQVTLTDRNKTPFEPAGHDEASLWKSDSNEAPKIKRNDQDIHYKSDLLNTFALLLGFVPQKFPNQRQGRFIVYEPEVILGVIEEY